MAKNAARESAEHPLPEPEEAKNIYAPALADDVSSARSHLLQISGHPPQVLHIEGRDTPSRVAMALWWAAALTCASPDAGPCLACSSCIRIAAGMHPDVLVFDGRDASIKIADVRTLHPLLGEKPHFARKRVVLFWEAQSLGIEAANSLLKILEEPSPDTTFVFTVPQRERLLPTLVSRGWVISLPWQATAASAEERSAADSLEGFLADGKNWFGQSRQRSDMDPLAAQKIIGVVQKALIEQYDGSAATPLGGILARLPEEELLRVNQLCQQHCEALQFQVNPGHVIDAFAAGLYRIVHGRG